MADIIFDKIFDFLVHENMGEEPKIKSLARLLTEIWDIQNVLGGHFEKWPPEPSEDKSRWGPGLKITVMGFTNCVPNFILVSQSAQFG